MSSLLIVLDLILIFVGLRLRQVDVKAEHFERQVQRVEVERDQWEKKYEESQEVFPPILLLENRSYLVTAIHGFQAGIGRGCFSSKLQ